MKSIAIPHPVKTPMAKGPTESRIALVIDAIRKSQGLAIGCHQLSCINMLSQVKAKRLDDDETLWEIHMASQYAAKFKRRSAIRQYIAR